MDFYTKIKHHASIKPQHSSSDERFLRPELQIRTDYRGEINGIRVNRGTDIIDYERTNRRASQVFDDKKGELHDFFSSSRDFASVMAGKKILDLGCGGGALVTDLRTLQLDAQGIDIYLNESCKRLKHFIQGDAFQIPFQEESFDCLTSIFSVYCYEPTSRIERLLAESFRVLKPGGRLIISGIHEAEKISKLPELCSKFRGTVFQSTQTESLQIIKRC